MRRAMRVGSSRGSDARKNLKFRKDSRDFEFVARLGEVEGASLLRGRVRDDV